MSTIPLKIIRSAQAAQKVTGCLASLTVAQWCLESAYGTQLCAHENPFGIKWYEGCPYGYKERNTHEYYEGAMHPVQARFINFPTLEAAFTYHGHLIMNPHGPYKAAISFAKDWRKFVAAVAPVYATDPSYQRNLIKIITDNHLDVYDH